MNEIETQDHSPLDDFPSIPGGPLIPGETKVERRIRLAKEARQRYRKSAKYKEAKKSYDLRRRYVSEEERGAFKEFLKKRIRKDRTRTPEKIEKDKARSREYYRIQKIKAEQLQQELGIKFGMRHSTSLINDGDLFRSFSLSQPEQEDIQAQYEQNIEDIKRFCGIVADNRREGKTTKPHEIDFFHYKAVHLMHDNKGMCAKCLARIKTPAGMRKFVEDPRDWEASPFQCNIFNDIPNEIFPRKDTK